MERVRWLFPRMLADGAKASHSSLHEKTSCALPSSAGSSESPRSPSAVTWNTWSARACSNGCTAAQWRLPSAAAHGELASAPDPHLDEKRRIGIAAAALVRPGDRVIFDSGTTVLEVARSLSNDLVDAGNLTAITSSLPIVQELGHRPGIHLILLGGIYLPEYRVVVGPQTVENLRGLHADKMFLGTDGLTLDHGLTTANVLEAEVDRAMVRAAAEIIVVADSSKIGGIGLTTILPLERVHKLITGQDAPADFVSALRAAGVDVILV